LHTDQMSLQEEVDLLLEYLTQHNILPA